MRRVRVDVHLDPADFLRQGSFVKSLFIGHPATLSLLRAELEEAVKPDARLVMTRADYLELIPAAASKGVALAHLCEHLGVPLRRTIAVGDQENDLEMIEAAGLGGMPIRGACSPPRGGWRHPRDGASSRCSRAEPDASLTGGHEPRILTWRLSRHRALLGFFPRAASGHAVTGAAALRTWPAETDSCSSTSMPIGRFRDAARIREAPARREPVLMLTAMPRGRRARARPRADASSQAFDPPRC